MTGPTLQRPIEASAVSAALVPGLSIAANVGVTRARSIRVAALIVAIIALSLGDLLMTLAHLRSVGLSEANPLARLVIQYNSSTLLVVWKCASVLLACLIFARYRHRTFTEVACWGAVLVLSGLTLQWMHYTSHTTELAQHLPLITHAEDPSHWVRLTD